MAFFRWFAGLPLAGLITLGLFAMMAGMIKLDRGLQPSKPTPLIEIFPKIEPTPPGNPNPPKSSPPYKPSTPCRYSTYAPRRTP